MARENYFLVLGLAPSDDWNTIEAALKKKQNEWTQGLTHPVRKNEFRQLLSQLPDMRRVLQDPALRQQEADEAVKAQQQKRGAALANLDTSIQVTAAKGYLTDDDVTELVKSSGLSDKEVRDRLRQLGVTLKQGPDPVQTIASQPRLDDVTNAKILRNLKALGKADLYDFLGAPRSSTTRVLKDSADREYGVVRTAAVKTPEVTIRQELLGDCQTIFKTDQERTRYDNTLAWNELAEIRQLAEQAGVGEGMIRAAVSDELIRRGKKIGLAAEEVIAAIQSVCTQRKWSLEVPAKPAAAALQLCGACGELAPANASLCPACRMPFQVNCPKCQTRCPSSARFCGNPNCGFAIGDMPYAERCLRSARAALHGNPEEAERFLQEALTFWPNHPEVAALRAVLQQRQQQRKQQAAPVEAALKAAQYEAAEKAVRDLERVCPDHPDLPAWRTLIQARRSEANRKVAEGQGHERAGRRDDAITSYEEALRLCTDCAGARDGLLRCPPLPPTDLRAVAGPNGIDLTWKRSVGLRSGSYRIVRKIGAAPTSPRDGQVLGPTSTEAFTDSTSEPGKVYYYAVFSERAGAISPQAALAQPVVRLAEVTALKGRAGDGVVSLEWHPPAGSTGIEVWRQQNGPPDSGTGVRVACVLNGASDSGLTNGTPYGYLIVAVFSGPDGRPRYSSGVSCLLTPARPPAPVTDLKVTVGTDIFEAQWKPLSGGQVRIYSLPAPPRYRVGEVIPFENLADFARAVPSTGSGSARGPLEGRTELHLFPVTVAGAVVVAGQTASLRWVPEITDLVAQAQGGSLSARWKWPAGVTTVLVLVRPDTWANGPLDTRATQTLYTQDQYNRQGGFRTSLPDVEQVHLTVHATLVRQGVQEYSSALKSRTVVSVRQPCLARYWVRARRNWLFLRTGEYVLRVAPDSFLELPELLLLGKAEGLPLSPTDGTVLARTPPGAVGGPLHPYQFHFRPPWPIDRANIRLFPVRPEDTDWLELMSAS